MGKSGREDTSLIQTVRECRALDKWPSLGIIFQAIMLYHDISDCTWAGKNSTSSQPCQCISKNLSFIQTATSPCISVDFRVYEVGPENVQPVFI